MGHTLNAIYMVKGSNGSKIHTVFCDFQPNETGPKSLSPAGIIFHLIITVVVSQTALSTWLFLKVSY